MAINDALIKYRNARWATADHATIYAEIFLDKAVNPAWEALHGQWVPFGASPLDPEGYGRALFARIVAEGDIAPYVPPVTGSEG